MRLTVLGRWSPYPPPDGACPGYLVEAEGRRLLLDCGPGVLPNLLRFISVYDLDAVVISHTHPDHMQDLFTLKIALEFERFPEVGPSVPLFAPRSMLDVLPPWIEVTPRSKFAERFHFHSITESDSVEVGPFVLRFALTLHSIPCFAVRIEAQARILAYSADTGPSESVEQLIRGAHLFLCECDLKAEYEHLAVQVGHLSPRQAGQMAARANVERLVLTHFFTPNPSIEEAESQAAKEFNGQVLIAKELDSYEV